MTSLSRILPALFLAFILAECLFPKKINGRNRLEDLAKSGKTGKEILKIYSLIKLKRADLGEKHAWKIARAISRESRNAAIDPMLVVALIDVESRFQTEAVSHRGARGLMQVRPDVVDELAQNGGPLTDFKAEAKNPHFLHDPSTNIKIGVSYLSYLKKKFRDLRLALVAYNWGPTKTRKILDEEQEIPEDYATRVLSTYDAYRNNRLPPSPWEAA
ncbi:MAG TPA: lytic transglycosylase domain-containing protein [Candidatus Acidoferrales bacterium]|nr:lytic transglycosylase domain-containing protein [Candidatus Acidoferrales bacterium]